MHIKIVPTIVTAWAAWTVCAAAHAAPWASDPKVTKALKRSSKVFVVTAKGWDSVDGELQVYRRTQKSWKKDGATIKVVLGKKGLGWGRGVADFTKLDGPVKKEGDGKAPAGVFRLQTTFGYDALKESKSHTHLTSDIQCVDDTASEHYNRILDRSKIAAPDWKSFEQMRRDDDLYRWGIVVEHNTGKAVAGSGSCIFIHIWRGPSQGTAGCTAFEAPAVERLVRGFDRKASALLVQLPDAEYQRLKTQWALP